MKDLLSSFVELVHLQSEMNKLFETLQELHQSGGEHEVGFSPPYDILETADSILVQVDLPGVRPDTLKISVQGGAITMEGERERTLAAGIEAYHLMERDQGTFLRRLRVEGAINTHRGEASYEHGVLTLSFPKVSDQRGRVVELPLAGQR